jgi:competence protein ComFC
MENGPGRTKEFALDLLFPKFCVNCKTEGFYLCPDCFSLIEILDRQYCPFCENPSVTFDGKTCKKCRRTKHLDGLYCAASYENQIIKKLIHSYKYEPFVKDMAPTLARLMISHLAVLNKLQNDFKDFILVPVPVHPKKLKFRGFNPAEELAKVLSEYLEIPVFPGALVKTKQTPPQAELKKEERQKNIKGIFSVENKGVVLENKILLVDDVFTTGATTEECALVLKRSGAGEVWGFATARG